MTLWSQLNDRLLGSVITAAALAAVAFVVVGLVRAWHSRRRYQLVIPDIDRADLGLHAAADISSLLRQWVRRVFNGPGAPDSASLAATVGADIAGGVVDLHIRVKDIPQLQLEIMSAPRDEMGILAEGIRAVIPDRSEGLLSVLLAALPAQRGSIVQPLVQRRKRTGVRQVGLSLDTGPIDRAHQASATFWSPGAPSGGDGAAPSDRDQLVELLRPTAAWIAIYLVAGSLPLRRARRLSFSRAFHGKEVRDEIDALRAILAAQLATYEMFWHATRPLIALGFADQALDDVNRARRLLPGYFRPHYIAGTIHELTGDALIMLRGRLNAADGAADRSLEQSYEHDAASSFDRAHNEFDRAQTLLGEWIRAGNEHAGELRTDFHIRSLKAPLRGSDPERALDRVLSEDITGTTPDQNYNVACLFAVASTVASGLGRDSDGQELAKRSAEELTAALGQDPTFADMIDSDPDLLSAFTPDALRDIAQAA